MNQPKHNLGPMAKLMWVQVFDQQALSTPKREAIPKNFQRGQEDAAGFSLPAICQWLGRSLKKQVTGVHTCRALPSGKSVDWTLEEFRGGAGESPFTDGTIVVCCCDGEELRRDLHEVFVAKVKSGAYKDIQVNIDAGPKRQSSMQRAFTRMVGSAAGDGARTQAAQHGPSQAESSEVLRPITKHHSEPELPTSTRSTPTMFHSESTGSRRRHSTPQALPTLPLWKLQGEKLPEDMRDTCLDDSNRSSSGSSQTVSTAVEEYIVDNSVLKAAIPGLRLLRSKHLGDRLHSVLVSWGEVVRGVDEGDGWVKMTNGMYMPAHIDGIRVLRPKDDTILSPPGTKINPKASSRAASPSPRRAMCEISTQTDPVFAIAHKSIAGARRGPAPRAACDESIKPNAMAVAAPRLPGCDDAPTIAPHTQPSTLLLRDGASPRSTWSFFSACSTPSGCAPPRHGARGKVAEEEGAFPPMQVV